MRSAREIWRLNIPLTQKCNLACDYCYVKKKNKNLAPAAYQKALKNFLASPGDVKEIVILGGEPLLFPDRLKKLVVYIRKLEKESGKKIKISLCTNLVVGRINAFSGIDSVFVSLDGSRSSHDRGRVSGERIRKKSFRRVFDNLKLAVKNKKTKDKIRLTKVISPDNAEFLFEDFVFLNRLKLPFNFSFAAGVAGWDRKRLIVLQENFAKIFREIEADLKKNRNRAGKSWANLLALPAVFCPFSNLSLGLDGKFYNCEFLALGDFGRRGFELGKALAKNCFYDLREKKCLEEECLRCGSVCSANNLVAGGKLKKSDVEGLRQAQKYRNFILTGLVKKRRVGMPRQTVLLNYKDETENNALNFFLWTNKFIPLSSDARVLFFSTGKEQGPETIGRRFNFSPTSDFKRLKLTEPILFFDCQSQEVYFMEGDKKSRKKINSEKEIRFLIKKKSIGNLRTGIKIIDFIT